MSHALMLGTTTGGEVEKVLVDSAGNLQVDVVSMSGGGDATLAEQQVQTGFLTTIQGDTTSLDAKVVACDTTGKATLLEQQAQTSLLATIQSDTTSLDAKVVACNTGAVVVSSGSITETNSASIASSVGKISQGYDATIATGGSGLQQNLVYGRDNVGDLEALKVNANGNLQVIVEEQTKETSVGQLWTAQSIGAGATLQTGSVDMATFRHIAVYGDTTSTLTDVIKIEFSDDNTNWYESDQSFIYPDSTSGQFAHTITEIICVRYVRFSTTNSDVSSHTYNLKYSALKH